MTSVLSAVLMNTRIKKIDGDEREMESGLNFNQLICEFESRHPCQFAGEC